VARRIIDVGITVTEAVNKKKRGKEDTQIIIYNYPKKNQD